MALYPLKEVWGHLKSALSLIRQTVSQRAGNSKVADYWKEPECLAYLFSYRMIFSDRSFMINLYYNVDIHFKVSPSYKI